MGYDIEVKEVTPQPMLAIRERTTAEKLGETLGRLYPEVVAYAERVGATPAGPTFAIYHEYGDESVDVEAGLLLAEPAEGEGRITAGELPGGSVAVTWHVGPYTTLGEAHQAMGEWVHRQGGEHGGPPREVYWTDPGDEPDSSKWRTEVLYPTT